MRGVYATVVGVREIVCVRGVHDRSWGCGKLCEGLHYRSWGCTVVGEGGELFEGCALP